MTHRCLNHRNLTYDICRNCNGKDIECPEYLSDIENNRSLGVKPSNSVNENLSVDYTPDNGTKLETTIYRPVEYRKLTILEAQLTTRFFLERFSRSQR